MAAKQVYLALVLALIGSSTQAHESIVTSVIIELQELFTSGCVALVSADTPNIVATDTIVRVTKLLNNRGIATWQQSYSALAAGILTCNHNRPLYVITKVDDDTKTFLQRSKVSSYPRWLIFLSSSNDIDVLFDKVNIPFDCELLVATKDGGDHVTLTEVYRVQDGYPLNKMVYGHWDAQTGLTHPDMVLHHRRNNLQGLVMRAGTVHSPPIIILERGINNSRLNVGGFFGQVWQVMEKRMNFTTEFLIPTDNGYGSQASNGSWNGMIAMILRNEIDIAINEFLMTPSRSATIDNILPIIFTSSRVFIRKPTSRTFNWTNFLKPFSARLWIALFQSILFVSAMLAFVYLVGRRNGNEEAEGESRFGPGDSLFSVIGLFCQQGSDITPFSAPGRLVFLMASIASLILIAAYSASLVSFLTIQTTRLPFETYQGMLLDGTYKLGVQAKSGKLNLLENTTDPLLKELFIRLVPKVDMPTTVREGLHRVCKKKKYAFFTAYDVAIGLSNELPCRIVHLSRASLPDSSGMVVPKNSAYRKIFNYNLQFLRHTGVLHRLRSNTWSAKMENPPTTFEEVTLEAVTPIFTIMLTGVAIGFTSMLAEIGICYIWHRFGRSLLTTSSPVGIEELGDSSSNYLPSISPVPSSSTSSPVLPPTPPPTALSFNKSSPTGSQRTRSYP